MRVSNHQLKELLSNIDNAAKTDEPLAKMYRTFIKQALLDLRDLRGDNAITEAKLSDLTKLKTSIQKEIRKPETVKRNYVDLNFLVQELDYTEFDSSNTEYIRKIAIYPLTRKEE